MVIQCANCGATGNVDETKRPAGVSSVVCPKCAANIPWPAPERSETSPLPADPEPTQPAASRAAAADCQLCKGSFSRDDMVRFGDNWVCAGCKPAYVQMISQGVPRPDEYRYAGFWIRFGAKMIDGLILVVLNLILNALLGQFIAKGADPSRMIGVTALISLVQMAAAAAYACYFLSSFQATPGKMACGLMVVVPASGPIGWQRALGRHFAEILSSVIMAIGYIMAAFDDEKRALHDRICATRVVYK